MKHYKITINTKSLVILTLMGFFLLATNFHAFSQEQGEWISLFNGKDLSGWEKSKGSAEFKAEGNQVIGVSVVGGPSTWLCTKKKYSDFIFEVDVQIESGLNSGIQFRSNGKYNNPIRGVHGYQAEMETGDRAWGGGIFDQTRRGWLYPVTRNDPGRQAFKNGQWNRYRIEAIGNNIRTWVNDVQVSNLVDDMTAEGFIGLQIHQIKDKELEGLTARWRDARIMTKNLESNRWPVATHATEISYLKNELTENEKRKGWYLLWDGQTTNGWKSAKKDDFPEFGWAINDGVLSVVESGGGESTHGGDIVTDKKFSDFELELEFNITPGANSGIKYFVDTNLNKGEGSSIGCEFQVLDNKLHPDANAGVNGNRMAGSLYDLITADDRPTIKPGTWNKARIIVKGGHVEHWLNNKKVVEYDRYSQMFKSLVAYSKYAKYKGFGTADSGRILLQDHGNAVSYRSIKIREF